VAGRAIPAHTGSKMINSFFPLRDDESTKCEG
jgi:hypothetical protein